MTAKQRSARKKGKTFGYQNTGMLFGINANLKILSRPVLISSFKKIRIQLSTAAESNFFDQIKHRTNMHRTHNLWFFKKWLQGVILQIFRPAL
jgi:hypothetical protein